VETKDFYKTFECADLFELEMKHSKEFLKTKDFSKNKLADGHV